MSEYSSLHIENARIESTFLGIDDHGFMATLYLDYGGGGQGFQIFLRDMPMKLLEDILDVVGVEKWESLKGRYIRAEHSWERIERIGNIIEDKWVNPKDYVIRQPVS